MHVVYEFGTFRLDPRRRLLEADGAPIHVTAKALDALVYLVLHDGELVQRSALIDALWPDTVVEENNLNQAISSLRRALGDGFIATVPGRGYQFIAEVRMTAGAPEPASAPTSTSALADVYDVATAFSPARRPSQTFRRLGSLRRGVPWRWAAVGAVVIVATAAVVGMLGQVTQNAPADAERPVTFFVDAPQGSTFGMAAGGPYPALSSDGRSLAFVAPFEKRHVVWIQTLGDLDARPLEGTEGAALPFWSPDGRFVGFAADGRLKRIATSSGGAAQDLSAAASYWGGTWSPKGAIVFAAGGGSIASRPAAARRAR